MKRFTRSVGALVAAAAVLAAAVTAALALATRPVAAQAQPRVIVQPFGATAWIGVSVRDVTADDASKAKLAQPSGVVVDSVREGSPAAKAGIQGGDIVVDFDGERVRSASHFTRLVQESVPDRQVAAVVVRGTSRQTLNVVPETSTAANRVMSDQALRKLENLQSRLPRNFNFDFDDFARGRGALQLGRNLGATVTPLTDQLATHFGVKQGVLVTTVAADSLAATAGLRAGDVITAINGQTVSSGADVTRALRESRSDGTLEIAVTRDKKPMTLKATIPAATPGTSGRGGLPV